ncbi:MAG TPA: FtsQ-type POTRA domain-containing protein, partial [Leptospiraceae bacterium]|nr:FtsQ-type POTRA domain-containing protein [Leptospiraceae bacterium]
MQENKAGRIRTWLIFAVITALAVIVYEFSLDYLPFENGEIILSGNKYLSKEEILQFIDVSEGKSIEKVDTKDWELRLKQNSRIRSVSVNRRSRSKI